LQEAWESCRKVCRKPQRDRGKCCGLCYILARTGHLYHLLFTAARSCTCNLVELLLAG
jgi:hypothetical protein